MSDEQKQKQGDYQKEYIKNMTDEKKKQKKKDDLRKYYKKYYAEKKFNKIIQHDNDKSYKSL